MPSSSSSAQPSAQLKSRHRARGSSVAVDFSSSSSPSSPSHEARQGQGEKEKGKGKGKGLGEVKEEEGKTELSGKDKNAIAVLVVLYLLQGIPVGLAFGTMPFLLKARLSYSDIGVFMLATYPYSLKLLWSPVVDSNYVESLRTPFGTLSLGRRKSWIVPIQTIVGVMLWFLGSNVDRLLLADHPNVYLITSLFFVLVFFAATQDIAVDGWALTLLSQENLSYASTAQTVGLNTGYFCSFTVFLAFNSTEFGNKYFRSEALDYPMLSLSAYLKASAVLYLLVTAWLLFFKQEDPEAEQEGMDTKSVYGVMWRICKLKHVQAFILVHFVAKIGFQANDAVTNLKLVEKGFAKEDLALAVLIDFPFQLVLGYLAARWSKGANALRPWLIGYVARLGFALVAMALVRGVPAPPIGSTYFALILATTVLGSFASTVQFVGISAFHTQIADPLIGGTYMTLLNTVSNLGGTWPRYFVLRAVDFFTLSACGAPGLEHHMPRSAAAAAWTADKLASEKDAHAVIGRECVSDAGKAACAAIGGSCHVLRDGYFATSTICIALGAVLLVLFITPVCRRLQALPPPAWRVSMNNSKGRVA